MPERAPKAFDNEYDLLRKICLSVEAGPAIGDNKMDLLRKICGALSTVDAGDTAHSLLEKIALAVSDLPDVGGGTATEVNIELDLEDQSPGFINLNEVPLLNVTITGGEPPAGLTASYFYVEAGPVEEVHFIVSSPVRYVWLDCGSSPDLDTVTSEGSWTGSALYIEAWQVATFTQPAEVWLDMQHCPLMTSLVFVGTDGHLTTRDCDNLATLDLTTVDGIHHWDTPDSALSTATKDAVIALCVANGTNGKRLWLMGGNLPTLSSPTATEFLLGFNSLPVDNGVSFTIAGRTFGENIPVGEAGFDSGYAWSVDSGASEDAATVAAAYAAVIGAHGFTVTDNLDGTLTIACDTAGPQGFRDNGAGEFTIIITTPGTGNAGLTTLIGRSWDVGI